MNESAVWAGRKILLGVSGGIAAYKAAELVRLFKKGGAEVQVLMTPDAARFVTPLTLGTLSEREVLTEIFPDNADGSWTRHVTLGLWGDMMIVAPATAQTIAKLAGGFCDSMLTAVALSARCPVLVCPAMDHDMIGHPATRANLDRLRGYGYYVMDPAFGALASGLTGEGRLPEPTEIAARAAEILGRDAAKKRLKGLTVLVTAGPTQEAIDPVRYLSNHSSGKMGFALAEAAVERGARVVLVSGPVALPTPPGVERIDVTTAGEMLAAATSHGNADVIIAAAAVADYRPSEAAPQKIKKSDADLVLRLRKNPDILATLAGGRREGQTFMGFALETENGRENALRKLQEKRLDWIVLNDPGDEGAGFGTDTNRVTLLGRDGTERALPLMSKRDLARVLIDAITEKEDAQAP